MTYAHDSHCNVIHTPGPQECPPHCDDERRRGEVRLAGGGRRVGMITAITVDGGELGLAHISVALDDAVRAALIDDLLLVEVGLTPIPAVPAPRVAKS